MCSRDDEIDESWMERKTRNNSQFCQIYERRKHVSIKVSQVVVVQEQIRQGAVIYDDDEDE